MKFSTIATIVGLVSTAAAQLPDLPICALVCLIDNYSATGCGMTDYACLCRNQAFINASAACIREDCSAADIEEANAGTVALCREHGVEIVIPAGRQSRVFRS